MHSDACSEETKVSKVKVAENGKQATFLNPERQLFVRTRVDGCLVKQATACDWWITRGTDASVLVELKGCDVSHALEQIEATFKYLSDNGLLTTRRAALIICRNPSNHPQFTTKLQRAKARLSKDYKAPLHIVVGNHEYQLDKVLCHSGPR